MVLSIRHITNLYETQQTSHTYKTSTRHSAPRHATVVWHIVQRVPAPSKTHRCLCRLPPSRSSCGLCNAELYVPDETQPRAKKALHYCVLPQPSQVVYSFLSSDLHLVTHTYSINMLKRSTFSHKNKFVRRTSGAVARAPHTALQGAELGEAARESIRRTLPPFWLVFAFAFAKPAVRDNGLYNN
jgi:hypothetical protein